MKKTFYRRETNESKYSDLGDWKFDNLPRQNDIIVYNHSIYYKIDFVVFNTDENAENIKIYSSRIEDPTNH